MPPGRIKSILSSRFAFAFVGLAFCVFSWGLQYKLSLYDPPQAVSHEIPQAKLLSKDQQSGGNDTLQKNEGDLDKAPAVGLFGLLFAFVLALDAAFRPGHSERYLAHQPVQYPGHTALTFFFFRPPPALS